MQWEKGVEMEVNRSDNMRLWCVTDEFGGYDDDVLFSILFFWGLCSGLGRRQLGAAGVERSKRVKDVAVVDRSDDAELAERAGH